MKRHEIPTHLGVEDRVFWGLSFRQVANLTAGFAGSYGLWNQWPDWPVSIRAALAVTAALLALVVTLVKPAGRGLEEWAFVVLRYLSLPKACGWRPRPPQLAEWRSATTGWAEAAPTLFWEARP